MDFNAPLTEGEPVSDPSVAPVDADVSSGPSSVRCSTCNRDVIPSARGHCPGCGRFLPLNTGALVTGLRSKHSAAAVESSRIEILDALFAERGGRDAVDTITRIRIESYALAYSQFKIIEAHLDAQGPLTTAGRQRSAVGLLASLSATIERLGAQIQNGAAPTESEIITIRRLIIDAPEESDNERSADRVTGVDSTSHDTTADATELTDAGPLSEAIAPTPAPKQRRAEATQPHSQVPGAGKLPGPEIPQIQKRHTTQEESDKAATELMMTMLGRRSPLDPR